MKLVYIASVDILFNTLTVQRNFKVMNYNFKGISFTLTVINV